MCFCSLGEQGGPCRTRANIAQASTPALHHGWYVWTYGQIYAGINGHPHTRTNSVGPLASRLDYTSRPPRQNVLLHRKLPCRSTQGQFLQSFSICALMSYYHYSKNNDNVNICFCVRGGFPSHSLYRCVFQRCTGCCSA